MRFSHPERAVRLALQAYRLALRMDHPVGVADALSLKALCDFALSNYGEAFSAMERSIHLYQDAGAEQRAAGMQYNLGYFHATLGNYPVAIESYLQSLMCDAHLQFRMVALAELGRTFALIGDVQRGLLFATEALHYPNPHEKEESLDLIHHGMGEIRLLQGEPEAALNHFEQALEIAGFRENTRRMGMALSGVGKIYLAQQGPEAAEALLARALDLHRGIAYKPGIGELHLHLGTLEMTRNNYSEAIIHITQGLKIGREIQSGPLLADAHIAMSRAFGRQGDAGRALEYLESAGGLRSEILPSSAFWRIADALAHFDSWRSRSEPDYTAGQQAIRLEARLETNERELLRARQGLDTATGLLESIEQDLRRHTRASDDDDRKKDLQAILGRIRAGRDVLSRSARDPEEPAGNAFTRRLLACHDSLTPAEIRICGLLWLNHSTKEIAQLLNVTVRNVDMHRWRIRGKLGLASGANLTAYLGSI